MKMRAPRFPNWAAAAALFLLGCLVVGVPRPVRAQRNCEWEVCPSALPQTETSSSSESAGNNRSRQRSAGSSLPCNGDDRGACQDECREVFGNDFHRCFTDCLSGRCVDNSKLSKQDLAHEKDDQQACLTEESARCNEECYGRSDKISCRRDCLKSHCPNAGRYDTAMESNSPGEVKCRRCREENNRKCVVRCRAANRMQSVGGAIVAGMGCEEMCYATSCGADCVKILPGITP